MAQKRYWNWQDNDSTFSLNQRDLLLLPEGRYKGFDKSATSNAWYFHLGHLITGKTKVKQDLSYTPKVGMWKTLQGVIVEEDAVIELTITPIPSIPSGGRYDLIVGEHYYEEVTGGSTAIYKVITGVASTVPLIPVVTIPEKQVILGVLFVPYDATSINSVGVTWTQEDTPNFSSDSTIVKTNTFQAITGEKLMSYIRFVGVEAQVFEAEEIIGLPSKSNLYYIENIHDDFINIGGFDNSFVGDYGWDFVIYTGQNLKIVDNGTVMSAPVKLSEEGEAYVNRGTNMKFFAFNGHPVTPYGGFTDPYFLGAASEVTTFGKHKMTGLVGSSYKEGSEADLYDLSVFTLKLLGNYTKVDLGGSDIDVKYLEDLFIDHPETSKGTEVWVEAYDGSINLIVGSPAGPSGFAVINSVKSEDFTVENGTLVKFIRNDTGWLIADILNAYYTIENLVRSFSALLDVTLAGLANRDLPLYDSAALKWKNVAIKTAIQETELTMVKRVTGHTRSVTVTPLVTTAGITIDAAYKALVLPSVSGSTQANFIDISLAGASTDYLACLPIAYPLNTIIHIRYTGAEKEGLILNAQLTDLLTYLPIKSKNVAFSVQDNQVLTIPKGQTISLKRNVDHWELISDNTAMQRTTLSNLPKANMALHAEAITAGCAIVSGTLTVTRDQQGQVRFINGGKIKRLGAGNYWGVLFRLPVGFLPLSDLLGSTGNRNFICPVVTSENTANADNPKWVVVSISPTGSVSVVGTVASSPTTSLVNEDVLDLRGIAFDTGTLA